MEKSSSSSRTYFQYGRISNILLLMIVNMIDDNMDLICLLLTCKSFYYDFRLKFQDTLKFNHLVIPNDNLPKSHYLNPTTVRSTIHFGMQAFYRMFLNSMFQDNDVAVITEIAGQGHHNRHTDDDFRKTAIYIRGESISNPPSSSVKTLYIDFRGNSKKDVNIVSMIRDGRDGLESLIVNDANIILDEKLPNSLEKLVLTGCGPSPLRNGNTIVLDRLLISNTSLTTLVIDPKLYLVNFHACSKTSSTFVWPPSITSLTVATSPDPINKHSLPLTLRYLDLIVNPRNAYRLDLSHHTQLETLKLESEKIDSTKVVLPKSLTYLSISRFIGANKEWFPPGLITFIGKRTFPEFKLGMLPTTIQVVDIECDTPTNIGQPPRLIKDLCVKCWKGSVLSADMPLLESLSLLFINNIDSDYIPNPTLKSLTLSHLGQLDLKDTTYLLHFNQLEYFSWSPAQQQQSTQPSTIVSSPKHYPPSIKTLEYRHQTSYPNQPITKIYLPTSLETYIYAAIQNTRLHPILNIFSIPDNIIIVDNLKETTGEEQKKIIDYLLPPNLTTLQCCLEWGLGDVYIFRIDNLINKTNVNRFILSDSFAKNTIFQLDIKRLDEKNKNVILTTDKSLYGGMITQILKQDEETTKDNQNGNQNQTQNEYQELYIHLRYNLKSFDKSLICNIISNPFPTKQSN
ncbi:hypothetical protein DFA_00415 [Cavenderia fasciculata]|uniref:Uncharacterized protein n=1 Tax=Cavenderia fasciculata TaxID=261658 RepID=F4PRQ5_CACFS|nr:uncharacterized protein DFA_00415 [Cavenderia fasciculata]EGG20554.1 hypothetical protein DFA_00415 [Cavenderia fasciculata]|eukprot:XP_004358404.1 hypothetical protein DFA_00415 [Cavenderia fasciculata]